MNVLHARNFKPQTRSIRQGGKGASVGVGADSGKQAMERGALGSFVDGCSVA